MDTGFPQFLPERFRFMRFMTIRDLPKRPAGHCRWCGTQVEKPRRHWCGDGCVEAFKLRAFQGLACLRVLERDKGVCAICGIDTLELKRLAFLIRNAMLGTIHDFRCRFDEPGVSDAFRQTHEWNSWKNEKAAWGHWNLYQRLWEADHIVPVVEGGGCCGLENYRTLCQLCHKNETAVLAGRRAESRAVKDGRGVQSTLKGF